MGLTRLFGAARRSAPAVRYFVAVLAALVATIARSMLDPLWGLKLPLILFFPAVMISGWIGGFGPGLVTTLLGAAATDYFWMAPVGSFAVADSADALALLVFVGVGILMSALNASWRRGALALVESEEHLKASLAKAEAAERRLRLALESGAMGTWQWVIRTGELIWSPSLEAIHGYAPATFPGTFEAFQGEIHPEDRTRVLQAIQAALEERREHRIDYRIVRADGTVRSVEGRGQIVFDAKGRPESMVGVCSDVTDRKQSEERFRLAVEGAPAAVIIVDPRGRIVLVNSLTENLLGYSRDEIIGQSVERLVPERFRRGHETFRAGFLTDSRKRPMGAGRDLYAVRKDGSEVPVEIGLSPLRTADGTLVMAAITDITERKRAAAALEAAVRARDDFISIASHELRNPVNSIQLQFAALLRSLQEDADAQRMRERISRAAIQVNRLAHLVDNLLDVSRISTGPIALEPEDLDFREVVQTVLDQFHGELEQQDVTVRMAQEPVVGHWDRVRLEQVVTNLLSNAIKYGNGKPIAVSLDTRNGSALLRIADQGIGIEPDVQDRLFGKFERAVSGLRYGGLGLGLWISRQIVRAMQGEISLESRPGEGSTFSVALPLRQPSPQVRGGPSAS
jgi:PAS domain S-box-containing protein